MTSETVRPAIAATANALNLDVVQLHGSEDVAAVRAALPTTELWAASADGAWTVAAAEYGRPIPAVVRSATPAARSTEPRTSVSATTAGCRRAAHAGPIYALDFQGENRVEGVYDGICW